MRRGLTFGHWMLALLLLFHIAPAVAQSKSEADRLNAEVVRLYRDGKNAVAIPLAKLVLALREKALGRSARTSALCLTTWPGSHWLT